MIACLCSTSRKKSRCAAARDHHSHGPSAKEKPQEAEVIALGTGKKDESSKVTPFEVKVGD